MARESFRNDLKHYTVAIIDSDAEIGDLVIRIVPDGGHPEGQRIGILKVRGRSFLVVAVERQQYRDAHEMCRLTNREIQIAFMVREGACNKAIAKRLRISPYTVGSYLKRVFSKLDCHTRAELAARVAAYAVRAPSAASRPPKAAVIDGPCSAMPRALRSVDDLSPSADLIPDEKLPP